MSISVETRATETDFRSEAEQDRHKTVLDRLLVLPAQSTLYLLKGENVDMRAGLRMLNMSDRMISLMMVRAGRVGLVEETRTKVIDHIDRLDAVKRSDRMVI